jgi:amidase
MSSNWEKLAEDKRSRISKSIPSEWIIKDRQENVSAFEYPKLSGLLSEQELKWTNSSATDLVAQLAKGQLKSVDLTTAFCKRAALAQQLVRSMDVSSAELHD